MAQYAVHRPEGHGIARVVMNAGHAEAAGASVLGERLGAHALVGQHGGSDGTAGRTSRDTPADATLPNDLHAVVGRGRGELLAGEGSSTLAQALPGRRRRALAQHLIDVHHRDHGQTGHGQVARDHAQERLPFALAADDLREADGREDQVEASSEIELGGIPVMGVTDSPRASARLTSSSIS